jgi:hypothetical protein
MATFKEADRSEKSHGKKSSFHIENRYNMYLDFLQGSDMTFGKIQEKVIHYEVACPNFPKSKRIGNGRSKKS